MWKTIRKNYRRLIASLLTMAMVVTNAGGNLGTIFAAGETENALFLVEGEELKEAIREAKEQGEVFDFSELHLAAKRKSIKTRYEKLLGKKEGAVYALNLEIDDSYAPEGTELQVFYNAGTEDVIFLFLNGSDMVVDYRVNIDGYETEPVRVNPNTANIEADGGEAPSYAENYEAADMIDDEAKKLGAEVLNPEETTGTAEEEPGTAEEESVDEPSAEETEDAAAEETSEALDASEESKEDDNSAETEGTESSEEADGNGEAEEGTPEDEGETEAEAESVEETEDDTETEAETEAEEETEAEAEASEEAGDEELLSISRHEAAIVAVSVEELEDRDEEIAEETEASEEETEEETEAETEAETEEESEAETEDKTEAGAESEGKEDETEADAEEKEEESEAGAETGNVPEEGAAGTETEGKPEESEAGAETESKPEAGETGTENGEDIIIEETGKDDGAEIPEEEDSSAADIPDSDGSGKGDQIEMDGQLLEDDNVEILGELKGKEYDTVTVLDHVNARAWKIALEDIEAIIVSEAMDYVVEYEVNYPDGAAVKGAASVAEGENLYFAVEPENGFEIVEVTANGWEVEEAEDVGDLASASNWKGYSHVYVVEGVEEDIWVNVEVEELAKVIAAATYTAETEDAVFIVDVPDGAFAEEVELQVSKIENESKLKEYAEQANGALTSSQVVAEVRAYDVSFVSKESGEELEPADTVSVGIRFKESAVAKETNNDQVTGLSVVHLPENDDAKVMTSVDDAKETEMEFTTDSFSVYAVTLNTTAGASIEDKGFASMQEAIDAAQDGDTIRLEKSIQENVKIENKKITIDINGKTWLSYGNGSTAGTASIITVSDSTLALVGEGTISGISVTNNTTWKNMGFETMRLSNGNLKYRTITATNTHLTIGEEGGEGPTIEGNGDTRYPLYETNKTRGGVILVDGGSLTMNAGTVQKGAIGGSSAAYGGGIAVIGGDGFTMNGGTITQNINKKSGSRYGGGVSVEKANFTMNGGEISGNTSGSYGGGVYVGGLAAAKAQVKIENGVITKNTANSYGGGLYVTSCEVITDQATFSGNTATSWGGAVYAHFSTAMTFNNTSFTDNTAGNRGGAICNSSYNNQKMTINGCIITGNKLTKALATTVGAGISDESGDLEITGGTVISGNTLSKGKGGGVYALKKNGETISFGDVTIAENKAAFGGGVAIDTGTGNLTAARKPSVAITEETKVYDNTAADDNTVAGTSAHVSDEFLFFTKDSNVNKNGFADHEVVIGGTGYLLVDGGDSLVETGSTSKGYHNYQESKIQQDECIGNGDVYLDPAEKTELYVWITDENGKQHGEKLTKENGLCVTLEDAYKAATQEGSSGLIYVCSQVTISAEDNQYFNDPSITYTRYKTNQSDYLFSIRSGETVTFAGAHIDGAKVDSGKAMVEVGPNSTLVIEDGTILENGNNTNKSGGGGAVYVHGLNYTIEPAILKMTGGTIRNNSAYKGGGIYASSGNQAYKHSTEVILTGGDITGNIASNDGGGISIVNSATLKMEEGNAVIEGNVSGAQGGGICIGSDWGSYDSSEGYIYSGTITGNRCVASLNNYAGGGGIHIWAGSTMRMKNVYITRNYATGDVSGQAALYSCPTGKLAIFELDGALITGNKSKMSYASFPDVYFLGRGRYADVSHIALGGGDNNWLIGTPKSTERAPRSYYQKTTETFRISSDVTDETIALGENEATVFLTENESHQPGSAIANNGTLIIGTETKALEVVKEWKDEAGKDTTDHPHQVIVNLAYRDSDGKLVILDEKTREDARQILSEENEWRYCWDKLGENTEWTVVEANVTGFAPEISEAVKVENPLLNDFYRVTITNKKDKDANPGSLTVSKKVYEEKEDPDGEETQSSGNEFTFVVEFTDPGNGLITYHITDAEGKRGDLQVIEDTSHFEVTIKDGEAFTVEGLPLGTGYTVTEAEASRKNYAVYINGKLIEDGKVTGTIKGAGSEDGAGEEESIKAEFAYVNVETTEISGVKVWEDDSNRDGVRPQSIKITLQSSNGLTYTKEVTADEEGSWNWTFTGLPKWDDEGNLLTYVISEEEVTDYSTIYAGGAPGELKEFDIKNVHTPGRTSRTVEKVWKDGENRDHVRPETVTVQLYETIDGDKRASGDAVTLSEENGWSYTWNDLFVNDNGKPITYSVEEVNVPEKYVAEVQETGTKFIITNTYQPLTVSKTVEKRWDDNENKDNLRPVSIQARLLADGQEVAVVILNETNGWKYTWTDLPVNRNGNQISYTVEEIEIPDGYSAVITYEGDLMVITNTHTPNTPGRPDRPGGGGGNPGGGNPGGGNPPGGPGTTTIEEPGVPLANLPPESMTELIEDSEVPLAALPRTGDSRHTKALMMMFGIAGLGMLLTAAGFRKRKDESDD